LRGDPFVPELAFWCRLDSGGAEILGMRKPLYISPKASSLPITGKASSVMP